MTERETDILHVFGMIDRAVKKNNYKLFIFLLRQLMPMIQDFRQQVLAEPTVYPMYLEYCEHAVFDRLMKYLEMACAMAETESELSFTVYYRFKSSFATEHLPDEIGQYLIHGLSDGDLPVQSGNSNQVH